MFQHGWVGYFVIPPLRSAAVPGAEALFSMGERGCE